MGLVAEMQEQQTEIEIGGTLQQRISSCLQVLDQFLRQDEAAVVSSMVVAEKRTSGAADNVVDCVANIMGKIFNFVFPPQNFVFKLQLYRVLRLWFFYFSCF